MRPPGAKQVTEFATTAGAPVGNGRERNHPVQFVRENGQHFIQVQRLVQAAAQDGQLIVGILPLVDDAHVFGGVSGLLKIDSVGVAGILLHALLRFRIRWCAFKRNPCRSR